MYGFTLSIVTQFLMFVNNYLNFFYKNFAQKSIYRFVHKFNAIPQKHGMASLILFFVFALDDKVDDPRGCHNNDNNCENNRRRLVFVSSHRFAAQREGVQASRESGRYSGAQA